MEAELLKLSLTFRGLSDDDEAKEEVKLAGDEEENDALSDGEDELGAPGGKVDEDDDVVPEE